jgi:hypothetical protein
VIKIVALIAKRPDMTPEAFRDYYEQHHAPLIESLSPALAAYRRNYVDQSTLWSADGLREVSVDVITELWFDDEEALAAQEEVMRDRDVRRRVAEDEARFMRRELTRIFRVDETGSSPTARHEKE